MWIWMLDFWIVLDLDMDFMDYVGFWYGFFLGLNIMFGYLYDYGLYMLEMELLCVLTEVQWLEGSMLKK